MLIDLLKLSFKVSRFRFWLYIGGTYITGYILGSDNLFDLVKLPFLLQVLYFMVPANIFLYGVNDLYDQDTDQFNLKKESKELRINQSTENDLKIVLWSSIAISILILLLYNNWTERALFLLFLGLSYGYSAKPFRFKARPLLDFSSNILYVIPGILGYYQTSGQLPHFLIIFALYLWTGAMHLFSAVPDIRSDDQAGLVTSAVLLGKEKSLWVCFLFWFVFVFIAVVIFQVFSPISYLGFIYPLIPLSILWLDDLDINRVYWFYPYINALFGFGLSVIGGWDIFLQFLNYIGL